MSTRNTVDFSPLAVSLKKAAELTGISKASLRYYSKIGRLRTVKIGRRIVIPMPSLRCFLTRNHPSQGNYPKKFEFKESI